MRMLKLTVLSLVALLAGANAASAKHQHAMYKGISFGVVRVPAGGYAAPGYGYAAPSYGYAAPSYGYAPASPSYGYGCYSSGMSSSGYAAPSYGYSAPIYGNGTRTSGNAYGGAPQRTLSPARTPCTTVA